METAYYCVHGHEELYGPLPLQDILDLDPPVARFSFSLEKPEWIHLPAPQRSAPPTAPPRIRPALLLPTPRTHTQPWSSPPPERPSLAWWLMNTLHTLLLTAILAALIYYS